MDKTLKALIAKLPKDNRRQIFLRLARRIMVREAATIARQQELEAKAAPATQWMNSLERVAKPGQAKK